MPRPADDLERLANEASWLLSAFDRDWLELGSPGGLFRNNGGTQKLAARGEYQRWMQDAQSWGLAALRSCERPTGLYRDQVRVDEILRAAGQAVMKNVAADAPEATHAALSKYLTAVRPGESTSTS